MIPAVNSEAPTIEVVFTRETLVRYAGAADDYVRQHWDHPYMIESGFPDVVVHGWLTFAHACRVVTEWLPPPEWAIAGYDVRYRRPTYPGLHTCGGRVSAARDDGVDILLWVKDASGQITTEATVKVRRTA